MPQRPTSFRFSLPIWLIVAVLVGPATAQVVDRSLAQHVPDDVGIFAELNEPEALLGVLAEPQIWASLAEIAGQPARPEETQRWKKVIEDTIRMTPQKAVETVCGEGIAFVGAGVGRSQDAVVIARPRGVQPEALIAGWDAQRVELEAAPPTWWLRRIGVAAHQDLLIFGDLLPPKGMFRHVAETLHGEAKINRLSEVAAFRALRRKLPDRPDGLVYARLGGALTTSQPVRPSSLLLADHIMVGLEREGRQLHLTAVADPSTDAPPRSSTTPADLTRLPRETLFAWEASVDYQYLADQLAKLPDDHFARMALRLLPPDASLEQLLKSLSGRTTLALGTVDRREQGLPELPVVGLRIAVLEPAEVAYCLDQLTQALQLLYGSLSLARGLPALPAADTRTFAGVDIQTVDLSALMPKDEPSLRGALRISWGIVDNTLLIATHDTWLEQMLAADRGAVPTLGESLRWTQRPPTRGSDNAVVLQCEAISRVGQRWLDYLKKSDAEVLTEAWWRARQPNASQLGIDVAQDRKARTLTVRSVQRNRPAQGFLQAGDAIVGCNGKRFRSDEPIREIRRAIEERPSARWVELLVERDSVLMPKRIPLPFINPVETLQRMVAFGRVADAMVLHDQGPYGWMTLRLSE